MYDDILLPVDGDTEATGVLHHAGEIAQWMDATVTLLFVADTTRDSVTVVETDVVDALEQRGQEIVTMAAGTMRSLDVEYETGVVQGGPAETIVDYAEEFDHDLIVMPTHGREGVARYVLGSVTEKVVRLADRPVLTARVREDEELTFPYESILLPTDGSPAATRAADHGIALADALDADVHVLSVVEEASLGLDVRSGLSDAEIEAAATEAAQEVSGMADARGVSAVTTAVEQGDPADEIAAYVETHDLDAVVMGTTGRRGLDRILLGSVAEKTVRSAPVPVVTIGGE